MPLNRLLTFLFLFVLIAGCTKPAPAPVTPSLANTRWSTFSFKSVVDGSNVYRILKFNTANSMEIYSANEKTRIIGTPDVYSYTYAEPTVTITINGNATTGIVSNNTIRYNNADYTKEP